MIGVRKDAAGLPTFLCLIMLLVVLLAFLLPVDCLGFSWPRQTTEAMDETEGLSSLGGLDPSSLFASANSS